MQRLRRGIRVIQIARYKDALGNAAEIASADGALYLFSRVIYQCQIAIADGVDRSLLLFRHVLNGDGQLSGVAADGKGRRLVVIAVPDVVIGIVKEQSTLGKGAGVLHGNQNTVQNSTGREIAAREVVVLAASGQDRKGAYNASSEKQTSFLQNLETSIRFKTTELAGKAKYNKANGRLSKHRLFPIP